MACCKARLGINSKEKGGGGGGGRGRQRTGGNRAEGDNVEEENRDRTIMDNSAPIVSAAASSDSVQSTTELCAIACKTAMYEEKGHLDLPPSRDAPEWKQKGFDQWSFEDESISFQVIQR